MIEIYLLFYVDAAGSAREKGCGGRCGGGEGPMRGAED